MGRLACAFAAFKRYEASTHLVAYAEAVGVPGAALTAISFAPVSSALRQMLKADDRDAPQSRSVRTIDVAAMQL